MNDIDNSYSHTNFIDTIAVSTTNHTVVKFIKKENEKYCSCPYILIHQGNSGDKTIEILTIKAEKIQYY